jgi:hypothetical protein
MAVRHNYIVPTIQSSLNDSTRRLISLNFHLFSATSSNRSLLAAYNIGFGVEFTPS